MKKVGIPRGLAYYQFYPMWKSFFEEIGAEVVLSDRTSKKIMDDGVKSCIDEACLALKIYYGHVLNLIGRADYLFIPRLTSISKNEFVCPKFGGLPDMIRNSLGNLPCVIDAEVNVRKNKDGGFRAALEIGRYFTNDDRLIRKAYRNSLKSLREYEDLLRKGHFPGEVPEQSRYAPSKEKNLRIAVIGHGYNLYDGYVNMGLLSKIREQNADVITIETMDGELLRQKSGTIPKKMFWNFGSKAVGAALCLLDRRDIDGILYVMAFGCGVDSFVCDYVERLVRRSRDLPFAVITIDEHSGEAGLNTRIEAFIDMIRWRKEHETDISAHGQHVHYGQGIVG